MGIERMSFVEVSGDAALLDDVLQRCLACGKFQPENAAQLGEFAVGALSMLRNPYAGILTRMQEIAARHHIALSDGELNQLPQQPAEELLTETQRILDELDDLSCSGEEAEEQAVREQLHTLPQRYGHIRFLHDAYDLRRYAVVVRGVFHVMGFVLQRDEAFFMEQFSGMDVTLNCVPAHENTRIKTPVRLRNNWFARPFEMFVTMYGSPSYNDIDPTPFVAYSYTLLFGVMFGDVGQGICIMLLGLLLSRLKGMPLGGIMTRIGVSSACFGVLYGSVLGFEHLLDPMYHALGFEEKPIEVMHSSTTTRLLLAAVALGAVLILVVILFNILTGIKHKDMDRTLLSHNGVAGLIFYGSALFAVLRAFTGGGAPGSLYCALLFGLPLLIIFLREPIVRLIHLKQGETIIHQHKTLLESADARDVEHGIRKLFTTEFVAVRFGRIPTDSYEKLHFYQEEPFLLHPIKSEREYIWCIYAMAATDKAMIDAIFADLYFEWVEIPADALESDSGTEDFIRACISADQPIQEPLTDSEGKPLSRRKTIKQAMFPDGIGGFFTESFFELFEVLLSFVTNTMSFLRVGGFILSHAGMMSVVFTLSSMVGAGAGPVVIIVGNLFVMGLEGLIVGIQALRLEFYEMFSRFFDADGSLFQPVSSGLEPETS